MVCQLTTVKAMLYILDQIQYNDLTMYNVFKCGHSVIEYASSYVYLGITLTEYLDYSITAKVVAQRAGRALGLLIAKFKSCGGLPYEVYTKLYYSLVIPVISYGASVWGTKSFPCINSIHYRAMRFFLGTGKYTPASAVQGDMGWKPVLIDQWKAVCNHWYRCLNYEESRLNKKIFNWAVSKGNSRCKKWPFMFKSKLNSLGLHNFIRLPFSAKHLCNTVSAVLMEKHVIELSNDLSRVTGLDGLGRNKLRTYRLFKSSYAAEFYCKLLRTDQHLPNFGVVLHH